MLFLVLVSAKWGSPEWAVPVASPGRHCTVRIVRKLLNCRLAGVAETRTFAGRAA